MWDSDISCHLYAAVPIRAEREELQKMIKISVITVCYNETDTIERTISSVIKQDNDDVEHIVIDGGSNDGTIDIIKKYEDNLAYWVSEPDNGIYDAMNKGIKRATGEWITFLNANDWYELNVFSKFCDLIRNNLADIIYGKVNKIENNEKNGYLGISEETNVEEIHATNLYCHQGLFIKKKLFDVIGLYDCKYKILADYDWILKAHNKGIHPFFWDFTVANFTMGGVSSVGNTKKECRDIIGKSYALHDLSPYIQRDVAKSAFAYYKMYDVEIFRTLVQSEKRFYIWGKGLYGQECFELLHKLNCEILGFIDRNASQVPYLGKHVSLYYEVICDEQFAKDENIIICVATEKYEEEIIGILNEYDIPNHKYISIGQLFKVALEKYLSR